jgi:NAD(P)-dependent dehydrogenase (short-subunit alcohol dehydrogenase family)
MGAAVARRLSVDGYRVLCADINQSAAAETAAELPDAEALAVDISDQASVREVVAAAGPELRAVVNSAGILSFAPALDLSLEDFDRVIKVNLRGSFILLQEAGRALAANGGGSIVAFASIESFRAVSGHAHYSASKAGVLLLTQAFADELGPSGVRVNAVAPGVIHTAMTAKWLELEENVRLVAGAVPLGRAGEPDEVAEVCAFLCSEAASYVTGVCWRVDGGTLIKTPM